MVTVSSVVHRVGRIDFADLNWERKPYRAWRAYGQSKLANLLFTSELQRRLHRAGSPVLAIAAHPGYAATNLQSHSGSRVLGFAMGTLGNRLLAQDAAAGALPTLYGRGRDVPGNSFAGPGGGLRPAGAARPAPACAASLPGHRRPTRYSGRLRAARWRAARRDSRRGLSGGTGRSVSTRRSVAAR